MSTESTPLCTVFRGEGNGWRWPAVTWEKYMKTLTNGLVHLGSVSLPGWGSRDPTRNGWKQWMIWLNVAFSAFLHLKYFSSWRLFKLLFCTLSFAGYGSLFCWLVGAAKQWPKTACRSNDNDFQNWTGKPKTAIFHHFAKPDTIRLLIRRCKCLGFAVDRTKIFPRSPMQSRQTTL